MIEKHLFQLSVQEASALIQESLLELLQKHPELLAAPLAQAATDSEEIINTQEVCRIFNISRPTCLEWRKAGKLPYYRKGSKVYFKRSEVMASMQGYNRDR